MDFSTLNANLNRDRWGAENYRALKLPLVKKVQESLIEFFPIVNESYQYNPIQVIDFFSGAGGTSLGFAALNNVIPAFQMLGGCDINEVSAKTYSRNFDTPLICEDIVRLANEDGALDKLLTSIGFDSNKPTVLIGCAPCQGFSSHRKRHWDEDDDVRNSLVMAFAAIVSKITPDVIIMENVPEFLSQKYWRYFSAAKKCYEDLGYTVKEHIYNAAAFGVPQDRFRTIVIGMKKEFLLPEGFLEPSEYRTVRYAISELPPVAAGVADPKDPMHKSAAHKQSTIDVIKQVPHDGGNRPEGVGPECLDRVKGFSDVYGRLYWDKPSITITHYARNPASGRYTHPEQDRGLTAREAALLQSFPNGFVFTGKSDDIYRQIGEAVPPMLSAAIAANTIIELLSVVPTEDELASSPKSINEPVSSSYSSVIAGIKMKDQASKATKYTCIDSFCGAGGLGLGLKRAGFNILLSFDIDQICIDTIKANKKYFSHPAEVADISDMLNGELLKKCGLKRGDLFLLAGGPPCQGFSVQRRGSDTDERNKLVLKYGKLIDELYPMYFVMENVTGIAGKRGKTILQQLIEAVEKIGYTVHVNLLDAQDYGVPQRRKRYIIVGERKDLGEHYEYPRPFDFRCTVRDTIGNLPVPPEDGADHPEISLHRRDRLSELNLKRIRAIKEGQGRDDLPDELLADCHKVDSSVIGFRSVYGRMAWDDVAPTITARFDSFTRGKFGHPVQDRSISLREGALLQCFPMDFVFTGNKVDIARQIGNAVPPLLAEQIGKSIIECYRKVGDK
nr:DNA cytosine methyltransferase [uncultured Ruminococcus sp.]